MVDTSSVPTWEVSEWDGPSTGPITFMVKSSSGEILTATTSDCLSYDFATLNGRKPSMTTRVLVGQAIIRYTFRYAYTRSRT